MKKPVATVLALTALAGLAGCGGAAAPQSPASSKAPASSSAPSAKTLFPNGVTLLVGFGPGGTVDTGARLLQPYLSKALGVPVVVQNMPGGGGNTAAQYEYRQKPDAPVFLMSFLPALTLGQVLGNGQYDLLKFTPLYGVFGNDTAVIIAKKGSPWKDFASLQHASRPLTAGTAGVKSSSTWMALAFLSLYNHIKVTPVPFKDGSQASEAAIGGSIDLSATTTVEASRLISAGKAQGVLEFAPHTYSFLPGVQSIAQVGKPEEAFTSVLGVNGPPNMPKAEVAVMEKALAEAATSPELAAQAKKVGLEVSPLSPSQWQKTIQQSYDTISANKAFLEKF